MNVSNLNTQQIDHNLGEDSVQIQEKSKVNFWMISTFVLGLFLLLMTSITILNFKKIDQIDSFPTPFAVPTKSNSNLPTGGQTSFAGTIKTGAELGELKNFCPSGLYLVADEGQYLAGETKLLQLRIPNGVDRTKLLSDQQYIDKSVELVGKYPAQEVFCEALTCDCEDYILVEQINVLNP